MAEDESWTLSALIRSVRQTLAAASLADPWLDSRLIVEHFTGTSRTEAVADPDRLIDAGQVAAVLAAAARRLDGVSVHRILGWREFHGLRLTLSAETLEPRPDTETLVDAVLPFVRDVVERNGTCRILDLGTGTGAIALALLKEVAGAEADGVDLAEDALATAARNAADAGLAGRFRTVFSDWYAETDGRYHLIVSNPPYIRRRELGALQREVRRSDPVRALDGGSDGLDAFRVIAAGAALRLKSGGRIGVEIGHDQQSDVVCLFGRAGFRSIEVRKDLCGRDRALVFGR